MNSKIISRCEVRFDKHIPEWWVAAFDQHGARCPQADYHTNDDSETGKLNADGMAEALIDSVAGATIYETYGEDENENPYG